MPLAPKEITMASLDLNKLHQQPTMSLTLRDKNRTVLHLKLATVATIERIQNVLSDVQEMKDKDVKNIMRTCPHRIKICVREYEDEK